MRSLIALSAALFQVAYSASFPCAPDAECVVTCANTTGVGFFDNCFGGTIVGGAASHLTVNCYDDESCSNLTISCPTTENTGINAIEQMCAVNCFGDGSCDGLEMQTEASYTIDIVCGHSESSEENSANPLCSSIVVDGSFSEGTHQPMEQYFSLNCTIQNGTSVGACTDITLMNIGSLAMSYANATADLLISCMDSPANSDVTACDNINVVDSGFTSFMLLGNGGVHASDFNMEHDSLRDVIVTIDPYGYFTSSSMTANNSQTIDISVDIHAFMQESSIHGDDLTTDMTFNAFANTQIDNCQFTGGIEFMSEGIVRSTIFVSSQAQTIYEIYDGQWIDNTVHQATGDANLDFVDSPTSGSVFALNADSLTVTCNSDDKTRACTGLTLEGPPLLNRTFRSSLVCISYGCNEIYLQSANGLSDWSLSAEDCPCTSSHCMSKFTVSCGSDGSQAEITDGNQCKQDVGNVQCCDSEFTNSASNLVCASESSEDSGLSDGAIAGIVVACVVIAILVIIGSYWCYRTKSEKYGGTYVGLATTNTQNQGGDYGALDSGN